MDVRTERRVTVITGGASGFGLGLADHSETAFALCTADPATTTGRVVHTQPFLRELGRLP